MPRKSNLTYFDFRGGMTSEAGLVPKDPSLYEWLENVNINRDGSVSRREALSFYSGFPGVFETSKFHALTATCFLPANLPTDSSYSTTVYFVIVHVNDKINFYYYQTSTGTFTELSADAYTINSSYDTSAYKTEFAINGDTIFVFNKAMPPLKITYDFTGTTSLFTTEEVSFYHRIIYDGNACTIAGDSSTPTKYYTALKYQATPTEGVTNTEYWKYYNNFEGETYPLYSSLTFVNSNIHEILVSDWTTWPPTSTPKNYKDGTFSNGRLWVLSDDDTIYYSQTIVDNENYNKFYTEADPLNKYDNAVVATDGGSLTISGAVNIKAIATFSSGIIVFATNGVWLVKGVDGAFTPNDFIIEKVTDDGIVGQCAYTYIGNNIAYASSSNIQIISSGDYYSPVKLQSISTKIFSMWRDVPYINKSLCKLIYNKGENKLYIFYSTEENINELVYFLPVPTLFDYALILDLSLDAWYIHTYNKYNVDDVAIGRLCEVYLNEYTLSLSGIHGYLSAEGTDTFTYAGLMFDTDYHILDFYGTVFEHSYGSYIAGVPQVLNDVSGRKSTNFIHVLSKTDNIKLIP